MAPPPPLPDDPGQSGDGPERCLSLELQGEAHPPDGRQQRPVLLLLLFLIRLPDHQRGLLCQKFHSDLNPVLGDISGRPGGK